MTMVPDVNGHVFTGLALDSSALFYIDFDPLGNHATLMRADLGGGAPVGLKTDGVMWDGYPKPVIVDDTRAYWADATTLWATPKTGGPSVALVALSSGSVWSLAMDLDTLYWTDSLAVYALPKSGGSPTTVATDSAGGIGGVAADGINVYWTEHYANSVSRVAKNGGPVVVLASGGGLPAGGAVVEPTAITVDASWVYYAGDGIARVAK
jgi:hypothetical protein